MIDAETGRAAARYARAVIAAALGGPPADAPSGGAWDELVATFVTIYRTRYSEDDLHGCMGTIEPRRPFSEDVAHNAMAAAFVDPRATPLTLDDVPSLQVEISVLSPIEPIEGITSEASAIAALRPGIDGVLLSCRGRRGTFLPQVWESLPDPHEFLEQLKAKAGLPFGFWSKDVQLSRYTVAKYVDPAVRSAFEAHV